MKNLESIIYNLVKKNAGLKDLLVKFYQGFFSIFGYMKGKVDSEYELKEIRNSFFGFHDRASMNSKGEVISHQSKNEFTHGIGSADIKITNIHTNEEKTITSTTCCNFQQGSLATWFNDDEIIFNDMVVNKPVTIILNIRTLTRRVIDNHFFSLSPNSVLVSQISFARFGLGLTGYGYDVTYPNALNDDALISVPEPGAGDFVVRDILLNEDIYRLSIAEAKELSSELAEDGYYYFSHSNFSPDSKKVYFLLRSSNKFYNSSQLFVYNLETEQLKALSSGGMASHLSWLDNNKIIAFCNTLKDKQYAYYLFDLKHDTIEKQTHPKLFKDGHPHAKNENEYFTDTYPDKERRQYLFKVNCKENTVETLLSVYSPMKFRGVIRVDFHPRLSMCNKYLTIDSSHHGDRSQIIIPLK